MNCTVTCFEESGKALFPAAPVSFSLLRSTDTPVDSLKAVFLYEDLFSQEIAGVDAFLGETLVFSGLVDEQELLIHSSGRWVTLTCRSKASLLCDNEALPAQYLETGIDSIFERHIRPYGFGSLQVSRQPPLSSFVVTKGESELDVLIRFCQLSGYPDPRFTPEGQLTLTKPKALGAWKVSNTDAAAIPFLSVAKTSARHTCISEIYLKSQDGIYRTCIENSHALQHGIRRKRYLAPAREWAIRADLDAQRRIRASMYNRMLVDAKLPGLYPISLFDRVVLEYDRFSSADCRVLGAKLERTSQGDSTQLILTEPEYLM